MWREDRKEECHGWHRKEKSLHAEYKLMVLARRAYVLSASAPRACDIAVAEFDWPLRSSA